MRLCVRVYREGRVCVERHACKAANVQVGHTAAAAWGGEDTVYLVGSIAALRKAYHTVPCDCQSRQSCACWCCRRLHRLRVHRHRNLHSNAHSYPAHPVPSHTVKGTACARAAVTQGVLGAGALSVTAPEVPVPQSQQARGKALPDLSKPGAGHKQTMTHKMWVQQYKDTNLSVPLASII